MSISRLIVTACLAGAMLAGAPALAEDGKRPDKVSFYFAAHEDDWQLFMKFRPRFRTSSAVRPRPCSCI